MSNWRELTETVHKKSEQLEKSISDGINEKNRHVVDQGLGFFRQLPRQMDYYPVYWSAYYPEIKKLLGDIYSTRAEIEKKYKLGQHKNDL